MKSQRKLTHWWVLKQTHFYYTWRSISGTWSILIYTESSRLYGKLEEICLKVFFFLTFVGYSVCGFHEWSRTISWQLVVNVAKSLTRSGLGLKRLMIANSSWQGKKQGKVVGQPVHCSGCKELRIKQEVGPAWKTSRPAPKDLVHPAGLCILMLP